MKIKEWIILVLALYVIVYAERLLYKIGSNDTIETVNEQRQEEKRQHKAKIESYESKIFEDSVIIVNSDRKYRDSMRSTVNPK